VQVTPDSSDRVAVRDAAQLLRRPLLLGVAAFDVEGITGNTFRVPMSFPCGVDTRKQMANRTGIAASNALVCGLGSQVDFLAPS